MRTLKGSRPHRVLRLATVAILNRPEPKIERWSFEVVSIPSGNAALVESGVFGRRTKAIRLEGIVAPQEGEELFEASRANLEKAAGEVIPSKPKRSVYEAANPQPKSEPTPLWTDMLVSVLRRLCFSLARHSRNQL
jgi:hypothetical protein